MSASRTDVGTSMRALRADADALAADAWWRKRPMASGHRRTRRSPAERAARLGGWARRSSARSGGGRLPSRRRRCGCSCNRLLGRLGACQAEPIADPGGARGGAGADFRALRDAGVMTEGDHISVVRAGRHPPAGGAMERDVLVRARRVAGPTVSRRALGRSSWRTHRLRLSLASFPFVASRG